MEFELENSIAWRLLARVRMEKIYMEWALGTNEKKATIDVPDAFGVSVRPRP